MHISAQRLCITEKCCPVRSQATASDFKIITSRVGKCTVHLGMLLIAICSYKWSTYSDLTIMRCHSKTSKPSLHITVYSKVAGRQAWRCAQLRRAKFGLDLDPAAMPYCVRFMQDRQSDQPRSHDVKVTKCLGLPCALACSSDRELFTSSEPGI